MAITDPVIRYEQAQQIVGTLRLVKRRPAMFIGTVDSLPKFVSWMMGFNLACDALGVKYSVDIERTVLLNMGLERRADGVWNQLIERGLSQEEIISTTVEIEIHKWELFAQLITK